MRSSPSRSFVASFLALLCAPVAVRAGEGAKPANLVANGDFRRSQNGDVEDWTVGLGAGKPLALSSRWESLEGGGLALEGDASVGHWTLFAQTIAVRPGASFSLTFESRAVGLKLEPGQFENAYAGVRLFGPPQAPATSFRVATASSETFVAEEVVFRAPGERVDVTVFLSKTGRLEVRHVAMRELAPAESLDVLAREMGRRYAHFDPAGPAWAEAVAARRTSFPKDGAAAAFVEAAKGLLAPLRDPHVWIRSAPGAALVVPYAPKVTPNGDLAAVARALTGARRVGKVAILGEVGADVGYVNLASLEGTDAEFGEVGAALDAWRAAKRGVLVDLRWNGGGDERRGMAIAARFADRDRVYARRRVRSGPKPTDLSAPADARLVPAKDADASTPLVVLVGPVCMSSGEGLAKMFHALPHVTLVGQPTRGASGNPAPVELPNGVDVWFSRWVDLLPDGTPLEGRGVPPDVAVDAKGPGDPTFVAGLALLREKISARPR